MDDLPALVNPLYPEGLTVWLDDIRSMPTGYHLHVKTAEDLLSLVRFGYVGGISFDNDLGRPMEGHHASAVIKALAHDGAIKPIRARVHSLNPDAARSIIADFGRANHYWGVDWFVPYEPDYR